MELYILRHAIAIERGTLDYPNDDRPLTEDGIAKMKNAAKGISKIVRGLDIILTSPLQRARSTAKIVASELKREGSIRICKQLLPDATLSDIYTALEKYSASPGIMIVGHEPALGLFTSRLIGASGSVIEFKKGGLCRVDIDRIHPEKPGRLIWHLTPKQLRLIGKK